MQVRQREAKRLSQGHTEGKQWPWGLHLSVQLLNPCSHQGRPPPPKYLLHECTNEVIASLMKLFKGGAQYNRGLN